MHRDTAARQEEGGTFTPHTSRNERTSIMIPTVNGNKPTLNTTRRKLRADLPQDATKRIGLDEE